MTRRAFTQDEILARLLDPMVNEGCLLYTSGSVLPFFDRPVSSVLAAMTFTALLWPVFAWTRDWLKSRRQVVAA